jgi:hypothetical protein
MNTSLCGAFGVCTTPNLSRKENSALPFRTAIGAERSSFLRVGADIRQPLAGGTMKRYLCGALVGAGVLVASSLGANAAPLAPQGQTPAAGTAIEKVHGYHRHCRRGHRHNRWGEWRSCGYYRHYSSPGIHLHFGYRDRHRHRHHHHHRHWRHRHW